MPSAKTDAATQLDSRNQLTAHRCKRQRSAADYDPQPSARQVSLALTAELYVITFGATRRRAMTSGRSGGASAAKGVPSCVVMFGCF